MPLIDAVPDALAKVYAQSLFELARDQGGQGKIEESLSELEEIVELARGDARFGEFLSSKILSKADRERSLGAIFTGRVSDLTLRFLQILNEKDRLGHLPAVVGAFDQFVQGAFGRVEVDVYTAAPLDPDQIGTIRDRLRTSLGRDPVIHPYTDPSMIGGLRLQIGDQLIDASVSTSLRRMRERLATTGAGEMRSRFDRVVSEGPGSNGAH